MTQHSDMTVPPVLLHIGYHKTATTWMQRKLFMPKYGYHALLSHAEIWKHIARPHRLHFDPDVARALIATRRAQATPGTVPVISSEILSGNPFFGGRDSHDFAHRLAQILPNARILISIRNQLNILPSVYMQYVLRGGTMEPARFFAGLSTPGYTAFEPAHFEYHHLVRLYRDLFGTDAVQLITQESLRTDRESTLFKLAEFSGNNHYRPIDPEDQRAANESYPEYSVPLLRRINHIQTAVLNPRPIFSVGKTPNGLYKLCGYVLKQPSVARLIREPFPVRAYVAQHFKDHYSQSNRILNAETPGMIDMTGYDGIDG